MGLIREKIFSMKLIKMISLFSVCVHPSVTKDWTFEEKENIITLGKIIDNLNHYINKSEGQ